MRLIDFYRSALLRSLLLFFIATQALCQAQPEKEKDAIKAVIIKETSSFMKLDHQAWSDAWVHTNYAYWSYADSAGSSYVDGWENINKTFDQYFKTQKPSTAKITQQWIEIVLYGNGAYARFIQRTEDSIDIDESSQMRVLEKKNGSWKIVCVGVVGK